MFRNIKTKIELFILEKRLDMDLVKSTVKECSKTLSKTTITFCAAYTLIAYFGFPKSIVTKCLKLGIGIFIASDILILLAAIGRIYEKSYIRILYIHIIFVYKRKIYTNIYMIQ